MAQVAGCDHPLTSPLVVKGEACAKIWALSQLGWSKHYFLLKKLLTVFSTSPLNKEPKHGGYSLLSMSTSSSLFLNDFDTAFLLFCDKELKELATRLSA